MPSRSRSASDGDFVERDADDLLDRRLGAVERSDRHRHVTDVGLAEPHLVDLGRVAGDERAVGWAPPDSVNSGCTVAQAGRPLPAGGSAVVDADGVDADGVVLDGAVVAVADDGAAEFVTVVVATPDAVGAAADVVATVLAAAAAVVLGPPAAGVVAVARGERDRGEQDGGRSTHRPMMARGRPVGPAILGAVDTARPRPSAAAPAERGSIGWWYAGMVLDLVHMPLVIGMVLFGATIWRGDTYLWVVSIVVIFQIATLGLPGDGAHGVDEAPVRPGYQQEWSFTALAVPHLRTVGRHRRVRVLPRARHGRAVRSSDVSSSR